MGNAADSMQTMLTTWKYMCAWKENCENILFQCEAMCDGAALKWRFGKKILMNIWDVFNVNKKKTVCFIDLEIPLAVSC